MACCGSPRCAGVERMFDQRLAARELARYRRRGLRKTSRMLRDELLAAGAAGGSLLEIGAGVGILARELVTRGVERAMAVDASPAAVAAGSEATRGQGLEPRFEWRQGDAVVLASELAAADTVALDRVICCYPACGELLETALAHARHRLGMVYPRDRWYVRWAAAVGNAVLRLTRNPFRAFVHSAAAIEHSIRDRGFALSSRGGTALWSVEVWRR